MRFIIVGTICSFLLPALQAWAAGNPADMANPALDRSKTEEKLEYRTKEIDETDQITGKTTYVSEPVGNDPGQKYPSGGADDLFHLTSVRLLPPPGKGVKLTPTCTSKEGRIYDKEHPNYAECTARVVDTTYGTTPEKTNLNSYSIEISK